MMKCVSLMLSTTEAKGQMNSLIGLSANESGMWNSYFSGFSV